MSDSSPAPVSSDSAAAAPESSAAAVGSESASAGVGNAPDSGVDAVGSSGVPGGSPAAQAAARFRILNREFNDQKHAETVLGSEITRARTTQRELAEAKKQAELYQAEINALRSMAVRPPGGAVGQGRSEGQQPSAGPKSFAKELAETGELDVIAKIFSDPEMGPGHAMYRMAELFDKRQQEQVGQVREEILGQFQQTQVRSQQERAVAKAIGATKTLSADYPELDGNNQSDEAQEAQQGILEIIKALPQVPGPNGEMVSMGAVWLAQDPDNALRWAADQYRRTNGTPMFAQPPGTSGSPSVLAAHASERAAGAAASVPLDGSGVPRQRPDGQRESFADKIRRENRELSQGTKSPSGRSLGF